MNDLCVCFLLLKKIGIIGANDHTKNFTGVAPEGKNVYIY